MRFRIRRRPDGTWLEHELLRRAWSYQDLAAHAGISRMRRGGTLLPRTARAIAQAIAGADGDVSTTLEQYFEVDGVAPTPLP